MRIGSYWVPLKTALGAVALLLLLAAVTLAVLVKPWRSGPVPLALAPAIHGDVYRASPSCRKDDCPLRPAAGARVEVSLKGQLVATVVADSLGRFAIPGLGLGRYRVRAVLPQGWEIERELVFNRAGVPPRLVIRAPPPVD